MNDDVWVLVFIGFVCFVVVGSLIAMLQHIVEQEKADDFAEMDKYIDDTKSFLKEMQSTGLRFTGTDPTCLWLGASGYQISMQQQELADYVRSYEHKADVAEQKHKDRCRWCGGYKNYHGQCKSCGGPE